MHNLTSPNPDFVPVNEPVFSGNEKKYLGECIDTGWISSEGPFVEKFERTFAAGIGRRHGIAVCNGSCALDVAVAALGIGPGDEVIMPTLTIISCAAAVIRAGAVPVLVDSDEGTWNMRVDMLEEMITPRTKAVMVVHLYGLPVDMYPVLEIARRHGLRIIEDAAQMHGQNYRGIPCGSFGDISTFSFYPNKLITTGEGGMVVTNDEELADKCRRLRNLGFRKPRFVHDELGWNYRMTSLQAALGLAQLEQLESFAERKRKMGRYYDQLLRGRDLLQLPLAMTDYAHNIYWVYGVVLTEKCPAPAQAVMDRLAERGIQTRPFFWCMHQQPVFSRMKLFSGNSFPTAERLARYGFYIPSGLAITTAQQELVAMRLGEVLDGLSG